MPVAGVAQLVEHELPKLGVAGSNPVARSIFLNGFMNDIINRPCNAQGVVTP